MSNQHQIMGVYTLYKLGRASQNQFDVKVKYLERELHIIPNSFADDTNAFSNINGLLYIKDETATDKYFRGEEFQKQTEYTAFEEVKSPVIEVAAVKKADEKWADAVEETVAEPVKAASDIIVNKPSVLKPLKKEDITESIEELRALFTAESGKKPQPMWGKVQLVKEISKLNKD